MTNRRGARDLRRAEGGARPARSREVADRDDPDARRGARGRLPGRRPARASRTTSSRAFGMRPDTWRLDPTAHPFASGGGIDDIRITTFYYPDNLDSLFATMHEYGHGLYEHQVDPALERTPLGSGVSLGLHESQSRMWENLVGRSLPFWRWLLPASCRRRSRARSAAVELERFYRAVNRVHPSLIRIHADEVTYNLHVILRFELEQDIVNGRVELRDLPRRGTRRCDEYLGIEVPSDAEGVLQDMHWSGGHDRLLLHVLARQRDVAPDLGAGARGHSRSPRAVRAGRVRRAARRGSASTCTGTGASSRRGRRSAASRAGRSTRGRICATSRRSTEPPRQRDPSGHVQGQTLDRSGKDPFNISAPPLHGQSCANSHSPARTGLSKT